MGSSMERNTEARRLKRASSVNFEQNSYLQAHKTEDVLNQLHKKIPLISVINSWAKKELQTNNVHCKMEDTSTKVTHTEYFAHKYVLEIDNLSTALIEYAESKRCIGIEDIQLYMKKIKQRLEDLKENGDEKAKFLLEDFGDPSQREQETKTHLSPPPDKGKSCADLGKVSSSDKVQETLISLSPGENCQPDLNLASADSCPMLITENMILAQTVEELQTTALHMYQWYEKANKDNYRTICDQAKTYWEGVKINADILKCFSEMPNAMVDFRNQPHIVISHGDQNRSATLEECILSYQGLVLPTSKIVNDAAKNIEDILATLSNMGDKVANIALMNINAERDLCSESLGGFGLPQQLRETLLSDTHQQPMSQPTDDISMPFTYDGPSNYFGY